MCCPRGLHRARRVGNQLPWHASASEQTSPRCSWARRSALVLFVAHRPGPDGCFGAGGGGAQCRPASAPAAPFHRTPDCRSARPGHRPGAGVSPRSTGVQRAAGGGARPPTVQPCTPRASATAAQGGGPRVILLAPPPGSASASAAPWPHFRGQWGRSGGPCALVPPPVTSSGPTSAAVAPWWGGSGGQVVRVGGLSSVVVGEVSSHQDTTIRRNFRGCT
jgi:hypothetical protein